MTSEIMTAGPWHVAPADDTDRQARGYRNVKAANGETIVSGWTKEPNARAIAALPALVAALQDARATILELSLSLGDLRECIAAGDEDLVHDTAEREETEKTRAAIEAALTLAGVAL